MLGYIVLFFIFGIKVISYGLMVFVLLCVGVNFGVGWGEFVGVSNIVEWWLKEKCGFVLGVYYIGYLIGVLLSGVVVSLVFVMFGEGSWCYCFLLVLFVVILLMIFWVKYFIVDCINMFY